MSAYYTTLFVPIDIAKNVNWFAAYAGYDLNPVVEPTKVRTDQTGLQRLTGVVEALRACGAYDRLVVGMEPTGVYHENWARSLHERYGSQDNGSQAQPPVDLCFVNPLLSNRRREDLNRGRKRKTDPVDLKAMAVCLRDGQGQPAFIPTAADLTFQLWGRRYRQTVRQQRRLGNAILADLDRLWPGAVVNLKRFKRTHPDLEPPVPLVSTKALERLTLRAILQHCPNPYDLLALGPDGIMAFLRTHMGRCGSKTAHKVYQLLHTAVLPAPPVAALLADQLQTDFDHYLALEARFTRLTAQAEQITPDSPAAVLTAIPGLSPILAARYLAHLGHFRRFTSPDEIWAFAGFDLVTQESGDFRRTGHITKKGEPGFRDTLYLIGFHTAKHIPAVARAKQKALARGKDQTRATIHAAHKANRICHHLLYHQLPFDPARAR